MALLTAPSPLIDMDIATGPSPVLVGPSTGAVAYGSPTPGIDAALRCAASIVELAALDETELPAVAAALGAAAAAFLRVSVHGPAKGRGLDDATLVAQLSRLGVDVVMHPGTFVPSPAWAGLGANLVVENNDGRKPVGQTPSELADIFEVLGDARLCIDVSHALHAGGPGAGVELAAAHGHRVAQIHVGCGCGEHLGPHLGGELLGELAATVDRLGWTPPVIIERAAPDDATLAAQMASVVEVLTGGSSTTPWW